MENNEIKEYYLTKVKHHLAVSEHYKEMYKMMNDAILNEDEYIPLDENKKVRTSSVKRNTQIPNAYPRGRILPPKVKFIINEFNRGTTEEEIIERIKDYEGEKARVLKNFAGCFYNLHRRKKILKFHYKTSGIIMYGLLDWKDEVSNTIKPDFHPSIEMITDISESLVIPENIIIQK